MLLAKIYSIEPAGNILEIALTKQYKEWEPPAEKIEVVTDGQGQTQDTSRALLTLEEMKLIYEELSELKNVSQLSIEEFEKDDDTNGHVDFVAASSNLRALCYKIPTETKFEIKRIAGKIIPALATTTAMICGFVALEMWKLHSPVSKPREDFRWGFVNLAQSLYAISEPAPCEKVKCEANGEYYSVWDSWYLEGDLTVGEFLQQAKEKYHVEPGMVTSSNYLLYSPFIFPRTKSPEWLGKKISTILVEDAKLEPLSEGQNLVSIVAICEDDKGQDIQTPAFILKVK